MTGHKKRDKKTDCGKRVVHLGPIDAVPCEIKKNCQELICACPQPKKKVKCNSDIIETSEITICEEVVPPTSIDVPHQIYPKIKCCDTNACPKAPIVVSSLEGVTFNALGLQFYLRAGAIDTNCRAEIAQISVPAGFSGSALIDYASDLAFTVIAGTATITVNTIPYAVSVGGFILVKSGSSFSISNPGVSPALLQLVAAGPGTLGFFNEIATYQTAVGSVFNLDPCIVEEIGRKWCILPAPGQSLCANGVPLTQLPGTIRFIPAPVGDCCNGTWGLKCCQYLAISAAVATPLPGTRPSVTIKPEDCTGSIVLDTAATTVAVSAVIVRDPECGVPEIITAPTVNGIPAAILITGASYYVLYDSCTNNVTIRPVAGTIPTSLAGITVPVL